MVILVKREKLIKGTQSYECILSLIFKDKMQIPITFYLLFFELPKALHQGPVHIFCPKSISLLVTLETVCKKGYGI